MLRPSLEKLPSPPEGKFGWPWTEDSSQLPEVISDVNPWPKISIVTPSYNQGQFIEETIRSVLLQGYPNLEYIIIDGGSNDESVEIIKKYEPWLTFWTSELDRGQSHALNKGFYRATGEIYGFINSDDVYASDIFYHAAQIFNITSEKPYWVAFSLSIFNASGENRLWCPTEFTNLYNWIYSHGMIPQCSVFWGHDLFKENNGFDENFDFVFDKDFFLRLLIKNYEYKIYPHITGSFFRLHKESKTCSRQKNFELERNIMITKIEKLLSAEQRTLLNDQIRHMEALKLITKAWEDEPRSVNNSIFLLLSSLKKEPPIIYDRYFWGGVKRVFLKIMDSNG